MNQDLRIRVVVGSKNPVKVRAVEEAFKKYWPGCEVRGIEVNSGVSAQPMSELETMKGARQRADLAIKTDVNAQYGVGIEGGVCEVEGKMFECAWACIVKQLPIKNFLPAVPTAQLLQAGQMTKSGKQRYDEGLGGGLYFELPEKIASKIRAGGELGPIMEQIMKFDVKRTNGAIGVLSKDQLDRKSAYVQIVLSALIKFVSPEWYA